MKTSGWIDRTGKYHGVPLWGHSDFANKKFGLTEHLMWEMKGWIKCSKGSGIFIFAGRNDLAPTLEQTITLKKWLKKVSINDLEFDKYWKEFKDNYLE